MENKLENESKAPENEASEGKFDYGLFSREPEKSQEERLEEREKSISAGNKRSKIIKAVFITASAALLIAIFVLIFPLLSPKHNPNKFVESYIKSIINEDWQKVYGNSDFGTSPFVSYEAFESFCRENPEGFSLSNSPVLDFEVQADKKENGIIYYSIRYITEGGDGGVYYISVKQTKNGFWHYDRYTACITENGICGAVIYAPCETEITVDGISVSKTQTISAKSADENKTVYYNEYKIDHIFEGEHELKAVNASCEEYVQKISITKAENKIYVNMKLSESCFNSLADKASQSVQAIYSAALSDSADKNALGFSAFFSDESFSSLISDIQQSAFFGNGYITVSDITVSNPAVKNGFSDYVLNCSAGNDICLAFDFDYTYKISNSAESTEESRSDTGSASIYYTYENGEWRISDISLYAYF